MNFLGLVIMNMFVDTWIHGFQIKRNMTEVNEFFIGDLNSWIALPMKYIELNSQRRKMISQLSKDLLEAINMLFF